MNNYIQQAKERFTQSSPTPFRVWNKTAKRFEEVGKFLLDANGQLFGRNGNTLIPVSSDDFIVTHYLMESFYDEPLFEGDIVLVDFMDTARNSETVKVRTLGILKKSKNGNEILVWCNGIMSRLAKDVYVFRCKGNVFQNEDVMERILARKGYGEDSRLFFAYEDAIYKQSWDTKDNKAVYVETGEEVIPNELIEYFPALQE